MPKHITVRVYMPDEEFKRRFQAACVLRGRKMSDVLLELAQEWLEKAEGSQKQTPPEPKNKRSRREESNKDG